MANKPTPEEMGEPALKIAGFQLWISGRQFAESKDIDDDWLSVVAHCGEGGASVWAQGALLELQDIIRFGKNCETLLSGGVRTIALEPAEPNIHIEIVATDKLGHFRMEVDITPDHLAQEHRFKFEIDQSYLPGIIEQCKRLAERLSANGV